MKQGRTWMMVGSLCWMLLGFGVGCAEEEDSPATEPAAEPAAEPEGEPAAEPAAEPVAEPEAVEAMMFTVSNEGGGMEGHTPRGFQGMGTGLFVGDNLNPNFPEGDGVQLFLSFDLSDVPAGEVQTAMLRSENGSTSGTPFEDLGALRAEEIRYDSFSSALWNLEPVAGGVSCLFADSAQGPFGCDIAGVVQSALDDGHPWAQVRLRLDTAGDSDGVQDLVLFFLTDSNTNEPGIFSLDIAVVPAE